MEAIFKKYFWVVNLVVLAVTAYLVALTVMDYLATKYLTVPPSEVSVSATDEATDLLEKVDDSELAETLVARSPFNVDDRVEPTDGKDCTPDCSGKSCGSDGCNGTCGECTEGQQCNEDGECEDGDDGPTESELNIQLVGTMVNPVNPDYKFANILADGKSTAVTVGDEILGKATVVDILPKFMYLREGNKLTHVGLWAKTSNKKNKSSARSSRIRPAVRNRPSPSSGSSSRARPGRKAKYDYSKGVRKVSNFEYQIDKQMLDEQLTDLTSLGMQARVIPNYRKGKYEGFKLVGVRPGSLYRAIGIRSGDIIRSINGRAINSPNKAMELFTQLKNSNSIAMEVERRGKIESFNYNIQ